MKNRTIYSFPESIKKNKDLIADALYLGCLQAKIVLTKTIALGSWTQLQCQFGCLHYGNTLTCPPCSPSMTEMSEVLMEYEKALLVEVEDTVDTNDIIVQLETRFKKRGFYKAFAISATACTLCTPCTTESNCKYPEKARPTFQAYGIDLRKTLLKNGWNLPPVNLEPCSPANNIAMLLID